MTILNKMEMINVFLSIAGIIGKMMMFPGLSVLLICGLGGLSITYLLRPFFIDTKSEFFKTKDKELVQRYRTVYLLVCFGLSITVLGVLFYLQHWNGFEKMTRVGGIASLIGIFGLMYIKRIIPEIKINSLLYFRLTVAIFAAIYIFQNS